MVLLYLVSVYMDCSVDNLFKWTVLSVLNLHRTACGYVDKSHGFQNSTQLKTGVLAGLIDCNSVKVG